MTNEAIKKLIDSTNKNIEFHTKRLRDIESEKCNNDDEKKSQEAEIFEIKSIISGFYDLIDYLNSLLK